MVCPTETQRQRQAAARLHGVGGVQAEHADGGVDAADGQEAGALASRRHGADVHSRHLALHLFLLHLRQLPHGVQLKIVQLATCQRNGYLHAILSDCRTTVNIYKNNQIENYK